MMENGTNVFTETNPEEKDLGIWMDYRLISTRRLLDIQ